jgi:ElaB/YqjD/DUF883 family membrane-anchored ribosome-binding protein
MADTFGNSYSPVTPRHGENTEFDRSIARNAEVASDGPSTLRDKIGEDVGSVKRTVVDVAHKATEKATEAAEQQKSRAAEQIEKMARALERVGKELRSEDAGAIGDYATQLGSSARQFAEKVKDKNLSQIAGVAEDFGRRQPFAFLGIAAVAGLAASRFLMASNDRTVSSTQTATQSNQQRETYYD